MASAQANARKCSLTIRKDIQRPINLVRRLPGALFFICALVFHAHGQLQTCPVNINFSARDLSNWSATTGLVDGATFSYNGTNAGLTSIPEYNISIPGIEVITTASTDRFGSFPTIPTINGYSYGYAIKLGSTATSHDLNSASRNPGGFTRSITYTINVPAGPVSVPYTMTYAYALVLENGTHNSNEQPLFRAMLETAAGLVSCASPEYYLPTFNNAGGGGQGGGASTGATLDSAAALLDGFTNSPELFLSYAGQNNGNGVLLQDVWTKSWTEVTFDLSPYRGQQVKITFETRNCDPGAHFAYAYVAMRNTCAGLEISGNSEACTNSENTYSIPALAGATYTWTVPSGWTINTGANSNIIQVTPGANGGEIIVRQVNSCTDLKDTLAVTTTLPTIAGTVNDDNRVCTGTNSTGLLLSGERGDVLDWLVSTDGVNWSSTGVTGLNYQANNLTATTHFKALVQNGTACSIDSSAAAVITVDALSAGGILSPGSTKICEGEEPQIELALQGSAGAVLNWQTSGNGLDWNGMNPVYQQPVFTPGTIHQTMFYRAVVQNGVCPEAISSVAELKYFAPTYPAASIAPEFSSICYGTSVQLSATITNGTSYTWNNPSVLASPGNGSITSLPYSLTTRATPLVSTPIVLSVYNEGCPNAYSDTFHISVIPPVKVFAGNDTAIVVGQPLQLNAISDVSEATDFRWTPLTGMTNPGIANPVVVLTANNAPGIYYVVSASTPEGCVGTDSIYVRVFKTPADIFMPNAFTPNGDGHNDVIMPIPAGIKQLNYFRIYNRWGQLVFHTNQVGTGWDGRLNGTPQSAAVFVYMLQAVDYNGNIVTKKGTFVLSR